MKIALILGGADCLEEDKRAALALFAPDYIVATNNAGRDYPDKVDHWVTFHPDKMSDWVRERRKKGLPDGYVLWKPAHRNNPQGLDMRSIPSYGGSSWIMASVLTAARPTKCAPSGARSASCPAPTDLAFSPGAKPRC